ncbi:hypothetical protein QAD02_000570 [Eretmocerus hayati]|uniref:Uncharacterized protein n=1 Tax=Eretmocerus hayati TaxID=131215 RepID=A0ACC2NF94_9HYME|nr:hypothetical protein QAD02_000570 [Eretmocerus hayati]
MIYIAIRNCTAMKFILTILLLINIAYNLDAKPITQGNDNDMSQTEQATTNSVPASVPADQGEDKVESSQQNGPEISIDDSVNKLSSPDPSSVETSESSTQSSPVTPSTRRSNIMKIAPRKRN